MRTRSGVRYLGSVLAALLLVPVGGCGGGLIGSIINDNIPPIENPGELQGKQFPVVIGAETSLTRAALPGSSDYAAPFSDIARVSQQDRLNFAEVRQNLTAEVTVIPAPGASLPPRITLSDPRLTVRFYEASDINATPTRETVFPALGGQREPLTYEQVPGTNIYRRNSIEIQLGPARVSGEDAKRLFRILTEPVPDTENRTNYARASLSLTADDTQLPAGSTIIFTFGAGQARVGL